MLKHKFYDMGIAPFRFVGIWSQPSRDLQEHNPGAYNSAMNEKPACCKFVCDHCGMPIMHHHMLADATGARFSVGSECVQKIDEVENISEAMATKKAHEKAARKVKTMAKREAEFAQREALLASQRAANGGADDWERDQATSLHAEYMASRKFVVLASYLIENLTQGSGFEGSVRQGLCKGRLPNGRGLNIMVDIIGKRYGRRNSKDYNAACDTADKCISNLESLVK